MATAKLLLYQNKNYKKDIQDLKNETYPLVIRLSHLSKNKYIETGYDVKPKDWDSNKNRVKNTYQNSGRVNARISNMLTKALDVIALPKASLKKMSVYQLAELIESRIDESFVVELKKDGLENITGTTLKEYGQLVADRYRKAKRHGSADLFEQAIDVVLKFNGSPDLLLSKISETFLDDLEAEWLGKGNKLGGLGVHLRSLRRIFNLAIKDKDTELTVENYPFGNHGYSIKKGKGKKRAISIDYIQKIRDLDYKINSTLWHHRNYFLFAFNLRGMNYADLVFLKLSNLKKDSEGNFDRLVYERRKTRRGDNVKTFNIKLTDEAKSILSIYTSGKNQSELIFPIMADVINCGDDLKIHNHKKYRLTFHNKNLSIIGKDIGLEEKITTYVARHTFATTGLYKGVSKTEIGAMMGHTSAVTTEAYFDEFEHDVLDNAADAIFN